MICTIDTPPNFCPGCGADLTKTFADHLMREDFGAGTGFTCNCGTQYQKAQAQIQAPVTGDLKCQLVQSVKRECRRFARLHLMLLFRCPRKFYTELAWAVVERLRDYDLVE